MHSYHAKDVDGVSHTRIPFKPPVSRQLSLVTLTACPAALNAPELSVLAISKTLRLTYMPLFRRKSQPRQAHSPPRHNAHTQSLTRCRQVPSNETRVRAMGREPIAAHCAAVQHCVGALRRLAVKSVWRCEPSGRPVGSQSQTADFIPLTRAVHTVCRDCAANDPTLSFRGGL